MSEEEYLEENKSQLDAESLLLTHLNRVGVFRDIDIRRYCSSVETLILMCPRKIRDKALSHMDDEKMLRVEYENVTKDKMKKFDDLLIYVNEQLEKDRMIWKKRNVKTYD